MREKRKDAMRVNFDRKELGLLKFKEVPDIMRNPEYAC